RCTMSCPTLTAAMAELQKKIKHPDIRLVAISVDPKHDTPAVLRTYAGNPAVAADPDRWLFLTDPSGEKQKTYDLIEKSFQQGRPQENEAPKKDPGLAFAHSN